MGTTGTKITLSPSDFQGQRGAPDTARDAVLLRNSRPRPSRRGRFQDKKTLQRKDNSSPGPPSTSPSSVRYRTCPEGPYLRVRDRLEPCSTAVQWNPSPASVLKALTWRICYYHQDMHGGAPGGLTARPPSTHATATILLMRRTFLNLHEGSSAVAARYRPNVERNPFSGIVARSVSCYTLLSEFRLPMASSDCLGATNTFHGFMSVSHRTP
ncbi:hypothetical protein JTE90_005346 [Oedothorax gibbosus]|uniref:Uncharacterized protein n=1 Tax=Oedothorax gibbosus TaxID=931172 RepID=A0AAV6TKA4_9ARAC|nr:hypothetical protein JTE90_005346 [Oedothorax gibbosus]